MATSLLESKYINEEIQFIDDHEQEIMTYEQAQITSNIHQYECQKSSEMNGENKRKRKWSSQNASQKYKNNLSYKPFTYKYHNDNNKIKHYYSNRTNSHLEPRESLQKYESINDDNEPNKKYYQESTDIDNISNQHEHHAMSIQTTVEPQKSKTAITLVNEWAMRGDGSFEKKQYAVTYTLVAITGHAHKPIFTYMCRVNDKTAKGEGQSKKKAKQNAAALMWEKLSKVYCTTNNDKVITSTTITDNFEVNENDTTNLTSTEGSQIINETDSNVEDEELQHTNDDKVKVAHFNMNPVGALQELSTAYKWTPPFYSFQKLGPLNKDQQQNGVYKQSYKVTCTVFHLQTTGIAITKKEAKRLAARLMFDQISNIGEEKLNTLKSLEFINDCEIEHEENQKSPQEWNSVQCFQSYFVAAIQPAVNITTDLSSSCFLSEGNKVGEEIEMKREYQKELEQSIVLFNSNLSAVDQLQALSQQLNFLVTYICVNDVGGQQQKTDNNINSQDEEFVVLVQVTTVPVISTLGHAKSLHEAAEVAASSILLSFKHMLIHMSSALIQNQNNDELAGQSTMANFGKI